MSRVQLRIVILGTGGDFTRPSLDAIGRHHRVVGLFRARPRARKGSTTRRVVGRLIRYARDPLVAWAWRRRVGCWTASSGRDPRLADRLSDLRPDLICIAGFPWLLPPEILRIPTLGVLNLHGSLLPRHRGILPLFWIYFHDDRETGVTLHWVTERADAGPILAQSRFPLARGFPVTTLNRTNADRGAELFAAALADSAAIGDPGRPQDEHRATPAPRVRPGAAMIPFDQWEVERVWHFCAGLYPWFIEPLHTASGGPVRYRGVEGFERCETGGRPGLVEPTSAGYILHCAGGVVRLRR